MNIQNKLTQSQLRADKNRPWAQEEKGFYLKRYEETKNISIQTRQPISKSIGQ